LQVIPSSEYPFSRQDESVIQAVPFKRYPVVQLVHLSVLNSEHFKHGDGHSKRRERGRK